MLGEKDDDWASFAYLWPNYVRIDQKNINNGTGSAADKDKMRKANLHSILALATQNNAQAREIMESRQTPNVGGGDGDDDGDEPELDGEADFAALRAHFEPKLQIYVGLKMKELDSCFEGLFVSWESNFGDAISKLQAVVRECGHLRCKPSEQQLITKFLGVMPDSGPWGQRKVMWTESTMNDNGTFKDITLKDMIGRARLAYMQMKESPEAKSAVKGFVSKAQKGSCGICGNRHTGKCWYSDKHAYSAMRNKQFNPKCYHCGKRGHIARNCPKKRSEKKSDDDDSDSEMDEATLRKAARLLKKRAKSSRFTVPGC